MSDHDALLAAILANPDDDTPRLVYADWLTENGDPDRGEFIRIDVELARTPPTTEADEQHRRALLSRRDELLKLHRSAWLAPFLPHVQDPRFTRGFVSSIDISALTFLSHAEQWFALTPLVRVKFTTCDLWDEAIGRFTTWTPALLRSPLLGRLQSLELDYCQLTAADIEVLRQCQNLSRLRELSLAGNDIRTEGAIVLAAMPHLKTLESLDVRNNHITDAGARAIVNSPYLGGLKELRISRNPIRSKSWTMLELRFGTALTG